MLKYKEGIVASIEQSAWLRCWTWLPVWIFFFTWNVVWDLLFCSRAMSTMLHECCNVWRQRYALRWGFCIVSHYYLLIGNVLQAWVDHIVTKFCGVAWCLHGGAHIFEMIWSIIHIYRKMKQFIIYSRQPMFGSPQMIQ